MDRTESNGSLGTRPHAVGRSPQHGVRRPLHGRPAAGARHPLSARRLHEARQNFDRIAGVVARGGLRATVSSSHLCFVGMQCTPFRSELFTPAAMTTSNCSNLFFLLSCCNH